MPECKIKLLDAREPDDNWSTTSDDLEVTPRAPLAAPVPISTMVNDGHAYDLAHRTCDLEYGGNSSWKPTERLVLAFEAAGIVSILLDEEFVYKDGHAVQDLHAADEVAAHSDFASEVDQEVQAVRADWWNS